MALRKLIEKEGKVTIVTDAFSFENGTQKVSFSAYVKVVGIYGTKSELTANVNFKSDSVSFDKHYQVPVSVDTNASNFIAQVYQHLKTLPEFDGAVDC